MSPSPHFINGHWVSGTGSVFYSQDSASGKKLWEGKEAEESLVNQAIEAASDAFKLWSQTDLETRLSYLQAFSDLLTKNKASLAEAISQETGKPLWDSTNEVTAMINKVPISLDAYHARCPLVTKPQAQNLSITRHRAHGVMAVLGPFNFPGHLPNGHIVPALLAGNTIVFKPSEMTPLVGELTIKYWEASGLPRGVINLVQGGRVTGAALASHPNIDGLLFTGSWQTGRHFAELMAKTPQKILALEMGGNNPLVIGKLSDYQAAAYLTIQSAFLSSGQRCTCARRVIIPEGPSGQKFLDALLAITQTIQVGAYTEKPEPFMGPVISRKAAEQLLKVQETLIAMGAVPLLPLSILSKGPAFLSPGILDVTSITHRPDEEYFGPLLQIIRVSDFKKALIEANQTQYGLTAGLLSDSREEYEFFYNFIKAGVINWNTPLTGASSAAPFGGIGHSGNHRPSAFYAADYCAYPVASLENATLHMPTALSPGLKA